jgi:methionine sulfoxide reductase catalytic subunit
MLIKVKKSWELPERAVTPEHMFFNRRRFMGAAAALTAFGSSAFAESDPSSGLYPAKLNAAFKDAGRAVTAESDNVAYNNYYEFGTSKQIADAAAAFPIRPWTLTIDGEVDAPITMAIDDLLKKVSLEERIYRHRCVEAWAMVVPWTGFTLKSLVALAKPKAGVKYVRFESFNKPDAAPGQQPSLLGAYPWPYVEGVTMAEAINDLPLMVTGAYGKPLANSMGAPLRLHLPWKYGFKSIKGIVKITFTNERPVGMWQAIQASEYGFWANVNPEVPHPRWSQASEEVLGTGERAPTQLFNGYGEFVAGLYQGLEAEPLYM